MARWPEAGRRGEKAVPHRLRRWIFDAAYGALTILLAPYAIYRVLREGKTRARWRAYARDLPERFGARRRRRGTAPCVWFHGVSVGEVKAAAHLIERIERDHAGLEIVITVSTDTGRRVARERYPAHRIDFYPPDLSWVTRRALDAIRPDLVVLVESEFWPNFLEHTRERGIPVVLVNGKMSARSAGRFRRAGRLGRMLLGALDVLCVQLPVHAERFASAGVEPRRIHVTGNMKLDNIPRQVPSAIEPGFARRLGAVGDVPLLVAGSTHPDEELALADIVAGLRSEGTPLRLVVAPRHPARADGVVAQLRRAGHEVRLRSRLDGHDAPPTEAVVLLDTVGELESAYACADLVFVGGSLVPHGGQNVMEPASAGRPVVTGPHVHNFRDEVAALGQADGIVVAADAAGVADTLRRWLADPQAARALGARGLGVIEAGKGATGRTLDVLAPLLAEAAGSARR